MILIFILFAYQRIIVLIDDQSGRYDATRGHAVLLNSLKQK